MEQALTDGEEKPERFQSKPFAPNPCGDDSQAIPYIVQLDCNANLQREACLNSLSVLDKFRVCNTNYSPRMSGGDIDERILT